MILSVWDEKKWKETDRDRVDTAAIGLRHPEGPFTTIIRERKRRRENANKC